MTEHCKDCGSVLPAHQPECPAQPYPSLQIEEQVESDPRERHQARRELESFVRGDKLIAAEIDRLQRIKK